MGLLQTRCVLQRAVAIICVVILLLLLSTCISVIISGQNYFSRIRYFTSNFLSIINILWSSMVLTLSLLVTPTIIWIISFSAHCSRLIPFLRHCSYNTVGTINISSHAHLLALGPNLPLLGTHIEENTNLAFPTFWSRENVKPYYKFLYILLF